MNAECETAKADLVAHMRRIAARLALAAGSEPPPGLPGKTDHLSGDGPLALLSTVFDLTPFEADVLLLCAGMELDADCAALVAQLQGGGAPNFALALAVLADAHWSALLPASPLRHWQLIEVTPGPSLIGASLRIDERILHYLLGLSYPDPELEECSSVIEPQPGSLAPSHLRLAETIARVWHAAREQGELPPLQQLSGGNAALNRRIAACAAAFADCRLLELRIEELPRAAEARADLIRRIEREALLEPACLLLSGEDSAEGADLVRTLRRIAERAHVPVLISMRGPVQTGSGTILKVAVEPVDPAEQARLWEALLTPAERVEGAIASVAHQFDLGVDAMRAAVIEARANAAQPRFDRALWTACRHQARLVQPGGIVQLVEAKVSWDDLVLPPQEHDILRAMVAQVRNRATVYRDWGFAGQSGLGLGIAAMFAGTSGTGKTHAAHVLARELDLDLYQIDLSQVVDKYIGETEKKLRGVFDAAEAGGAILLFDEADALFGKRSEIKDSHDRHANIEVSYLLQRIEAYRGLAILTTNLKDGIDAAFLRRLRFVVNFPFPSASDRARIWRAVLPPATPCHDLDFARLGQLVVSGGNIRTIALNAAFTAAAAREPLAMRHIAAAAQLEYAKLDRTMSEAELAGWS